MNPDELVSLAQRARAAAYCPYSGYAVGAALATPSWATFAGCNVENASYGATICAERAAVLAMVAGEERTWKALAVATRDGATPCGACLQVLAEFAESPDAQVICANDAGECVVYEFCRLFPQPFSLPPGGALSE